MKEKSWTFFLNTRHRKQPGNLDPSSLPPQAGQVCGPASHSPARRAPGSASCLLPARRPPSAAPPQPKSPSREMVEAAGPSWTTPPPFPIGFLVSLPLPRPRADPLRAPSLSPRFRKAGARFGVPAAPQALGRRVAALPLLEERLAGTRRKPGSLSWVHRPPAPRISRAPAPHWWWSCRQNSGPTGVGKGVRLPRKKIRVRGAGVSWGVGADLFFSRPDFANSSPG